LNDFQICSLISGVDVSNIEQIRQQVAELRQIINTTFESGELGEVGKQNRHLFLFC